MREKNLITYTQSDFIHDIASDYAGVYDRNDIRNILEAYEMHIREHLAEAAELEKPVVVKLFSGLQLNSCFIAKHKTNAPFMEGLEVDDKIRVKARTTRYFVRRLNDMVFDQN